MPYTIQQLIEELSQYDPDTPVMMASDSEGNSFSPCDDCGPARFTIEGYYINTGIAELTPELEESGFTEDDVPPGPLCVTLWPGYPDEKLHAMEAAYQAQPQEVDSE